MLSRNGNSPFRTDRYEAKRGRDRVFLARSGTRYFGFSQKRPSARFPQSIVDKVPSVIEFTAPWRGPQLTEARMPTYRFCILSYRRGDLPAGSTEDDVPILLAVYTETGVLTFYRNPMSELIVDEKDSELVAALFDDFKARSQVAPLELFKHLSELNSAPLVTEHLGITEWRDSARIRWTPTFTGL